MNVEGRRPGARCASSSRRTSSCWRRTSTGSARCSRTLEHHRVAAPGPLRGSPDAVSSPSSARGAARVLERGRASTPRPRAPRLTRPSRSRATRCASCARATCRGGGFVLHAAPEAAAAVWEALRAAGARPVGPRRPRRPARRGAAALVRVGRDRGEPAARDGPRRRVPLARQGLLRRPGGGRAPRGPRRQRQQGPARAAPVGAGRGRRGGQRRGTGDRPRDDRGRVAAPRARSRWPTSTAATSPRAPPSRSTARRPPS